MNLNLFVSLGNIIGYWPSWRDGIEQVSVDNFTHLIYAFGSFDESGNISIENVDSLRQFVAIDGSCQKMLSLGGYNLSKAFSSLAASSENRSNFVSNAEQIMKAYGLRKFTLMNLCVCVCVCVKHYYQHFNLQMDWISLGAVSFQRDLKIEKISRNF